MLTHQVCWVGPRYTGWKLPYFYQRAPSPPFKITLCLLSKSVVSHFFIHFLACSSFREALVTFYLTDMQTFGYVKPSFVRNSYTLKSWWFVSQEKGTKWENSLFHVMGSSGPLPGQMRSWRDARIQHTVTLIVMDYKADIKYKKQWTGHMRRKKLESGTSLKGFSLSRVTQDA